MTFQNHFTLTGWYPVPLLGQHTRVLGCTAPNNYLNLSAESGQEHIVHSCLNLKLSLWVNGDAQTLSHVILLVANTHVIEEIVSNVRVKIYSDAIRTYVHKIHAPAFDLNSPGRAYIHNGSHVDLDLSMTGPQLVEFANTKITNSSITFKSINELNLTNCQFSQVRWRESAMLRKLNVLNNSILDLTLIKCIEQHGFTQRFIEGRVYCSDTAVEISKKFRSEIYLPYSKTISESEPTIQH